MSRLLSLDIPLNKQLKKSISSTSQRVLTGGLGISITTTNGWLKAITEIDDKQFVLGTCDKAKFAYLDCPLEVSETGHISMDMCLKIEDSYVFFEINPNLILTSGQTVWKADIKVTPSKLELIKLGHRELKILKQVIRPVSEVLLVGISDLVIETSEGVQLKPEYSDGGILSFGKTKNTTKTNNKGNDAYPANSQGPYEYQSDHRSQGPYRPDYRIQGPFVPHPDRFQYRPQWIPPPPIWSNPPTIEKQYSNMSGRSDLKSEATKIREELKTISDKNSSYENKPSQDESVEQPTPSSSHSTTASEPINIVKLNENEYDFIDLSPEFVELWTSSKTESSV